MTFFKMYAHTCIEEYVRPGDALDVCERGCYKSEMQFLEKTPLEVEISNEGGVEFPDFLVHGECMPLVSEHFRDLLDGLGVDNLFYRRVFLTSSLLGRREHYWLAVPPRIRCLNVYASTVEVEDNESLRDDELLREVTNIVIDPRGVGNYRIFKLPMEYTNQEIIVTEELRNAIAAQALSNVNFVKLQGGKS